MSTRHRASYNTGFIRYADKLKGTDEVSVPFSRTVQKPYGRRKNITDYSFTAPAARPLIIYLESKKYSITIGTAINTDPAAKRANSVSGKDIKPTATVHLSRSLRSNLGNMKSLQGHANCVKRVYTIMGLERGKVILQKICRLFAPSIRAAS